MAPSSIVQFSGFSLAFQPSRLLPSNNTIQPSSGFSSAAHAWLPRTAPKTGSSSEGHFLIVFNSMSRPVSKDVAVVRALSHSSWDARGPRVSSLADGRPPYDRHEPKRRSALV